MASDYGLNFGFRRSDESLATREGRFRTPGSGTQLLLGTAVEVDPANPGFLRQAAANAAPTTGLSGLLVQEDNFLGSIFEASPLTGHDSLDIGLAKLGTLSIMWGGVGSKVWLANTDAYSRFGRDKPAVSIVDLTGVAVGGALGWSGSKWVAAASGSTPGWLSVTNVSTDYCEAVITF